MSYRIVLSIKRIERLWNKRIGANMASVVKKKAIPAKPEMTAQEKKQAKRKANEEAMCWTQEPDRKRSENGKEMTLFQYMNTPLHRKWGLELKHLKNGLTQEQIGNSRKDKRLTEPCKEKTGKGSIRFCSNCRRKVRRMQLKVNNVTLAKRKEEGKAGHHKKYRGKDTIIIKALKKLGEDPEKRIGQGKTLGQALLAKVEKILPELTGANANPAKAAGRKSSEKDAKAPVHKSESKVKQGPLSKPKKSTKKIIEEHQQAQATVLKSLDSGPVITNSEPDPALMQAAANVPSAQIAP